MTWIDDTVKSLIQGHNFYLSLEQHYLSPCLHFRVLPCTETVYVRGELCMLHHRPILLFLFLSNLLSLRFSFYLLIISLIH